jgi:hypothetical protein
MPLMAKPQYAFWLTRASKQDKSICRSVDGCCCRSLTAMGAPVSGYFGSGVQMNVKLQVFVFKGIF